VQELFFLKKDLGREGIKRATFEDNGCGTSKDGRQEDQKNVRDDHHLILLSRSSVSRHINTFPAIPAREDGQQANQPFGHGKFHFIATTYFAAARSKRWDIGSAHRSKYKDFHKMFLFPITLALQNTDNKILPICQVLSAHTVARNLHQENNL
jgi:hypothetical protein